MKSRTAGQDWSECPAMTWRRKLGCAPNPRDAWLSMPLRITDRTTVQLRHRNPKASAPESNAKSLISNSRKLPVACLIPLSMAGFAFAEG
jgi:hypothetical protein